MTPTAAAAPWRTHPSGLIVPNEISRAREVWTWQAWRDLEKVTKHLTARHLAIFFRCQEPSCPDPTITRVRNPDGGLTIRCGHLDRVVMRAI